MISIGRWSRFAGVALLGIVGVAALCAAIYMAWLFHDMPNAGDLADYHPPTATRVYAWDGTLIGEFSHERRIYVPYDQIPPQLADAFLAAEDHNFFTHGGVDVGGVCAGDDQGRLQHRCRAAGPRAARPSPSRWPRTSC